MPEYPEQVLPQERVRTGARDEEVRPVEAVEEELDKRHRDDRERQDQQERRHQRHPREQRHPHQRHARRAHVQDRHDEVERSRQRGDSEHLQAKNPKVDAVPRVVRQSRDRRVAEPPCVRRAAHEPAQLQNQRAGQEGPVAEGIEARERHVSRSYLQRNDVVEERRPHRHHAQEDHRRGVHRKELVEYLRANQLGLGRCQLGADVQRLDSARRKHDEGGHAVQDADLLVIDSREPVPYARGMGRTFRQWYRKCCHGISLDLRSVTVSPGYTVPAPLFELRSASASGRCRPVRQWPSYSPA